MHRVTEGLNVCIRFPAYVYTCEQLALYCKMIDGSAFNTLVKINVELHACNPYPPMTTCLKLAYSKLASVLHVTTVFCVKTLF